MADSFIHTNLSKEARKTHKQKQITVLMRYEMVVIANKRSVYLVFVKETVEAAIAGLQRGTCARHLGIFKFSLPRSRLV